MFMVVSEPRHGVVAIVRQPVIGGELIGSAEFLVAHSEMDPGYETGGYARVLLL